MIMVAGEQGVASLNQVRAQLWSGDARPEGHQWGMGFLGKGQPAPPHQVGGLGSAVSSSRGLLTCFLATCHQIAFPGTWPTLFILASCNCVLSCLCLYDCNTLLYRPIHLWALSVLWGTAPLSPRADAPAGKDTPEYCLKAATGY